MMRKVLCLLLLSCFLLFAGCAGEGAQPNSSGNAAVDAATATKIKQELEETPIPKGYSALLDEDFLTVTCIEGNAIVQIRAFMPYTIPYVADIFLPAAQAAADKEGVTLSEFSVSSYMRNNDGIIKETLSNWSTKDGSSGTLTDQSSGDIVIKTDFTITDMYEYYSNFHSVIQDMVEELGGKLE